MFVNVAANAEIALDTKIEQNWKQGGFYAYHLSDDIMIIGLNGMYPFYENFENPEMAMEMLDWLSRTLEENPDKRFITQTHVFFGNNWYKNLEVLWNKTYTNEVLRILHKHQDRLIICVGAHIHHVHMMAPYHPLIDDLNVVTVISPAISPIYMNNPGYGQMTFSAEHGVENLLFRFF